SAGAHRAVRHRYTYVPAFRASRHRRSGSPQFRRDPVCARMAIRSVDRDHHDAHGAGPLTGLDESFEQPGERRAPGEQLLVDLDGYEGPIDLLLNLAREQKVDLTRISMLQLADQYLAFIAAARELKLEIAADYLVMAAWLAYLKSRLLLPEP